MRKEDIEALATWVANDEPSKEIALHPRARADAGLHRRPRRGRPRGHARRDGRHGRRPGQDQPAGPGRAGDRPLGPGRRLSARATPSASTPSGSSSATSERYAFLRWGQDAFENFRVVPPDTGIVHQVNLEYLARVVFTDEMGSDAHRVRPIPTRSSGTDSHTTMINGLGVLGWGVGGIEAEAAMLGQPISMLIPEVVASGCMASCPKARRPPTSCSRSPSCCASTASWASSSSSTARAWPTCRSPTARRSATCARSSARPARSSRSTPRPLRYLRLRPRQSRSTAEAYAKEQGLCLRRRHPGAGLPETLELDLAEVVPCLAGPKRPQDRVSLTESKHLSFPARACRWHGGRPESAQPRNARCRATCLPGLGPTVRLERQRPRPARAGKWLYPLPVRHDHQPGVAPRGRGRRPRARRDRRDHELHEHVEPVGDAGRRPARQEGRRARLTTKPWVKTSLAPGSKVAADHMSGRPDPRHCEALGFHLVGYGCTTCIGNSGPLARRRSPRRQWQQPRRSWSALSGNRNFEGRINPDVKMNYLASPPLVVAYASPARWTSTCSTSRSARTRTARTSS